MQQLLFNGSNVCRDAQWFFQVIGSFGSRILRFAFPVPSFFSFLISSSSPPLETVRALFKERVLSRHNRAVAHKKSQQSWQHAGDFWKPKLDKIPAWSWRVCHEIPPLAEQLLVFDSWWKRESHFSLMMWPQVGGPLHGRHNLPE